MNRLFISLLCCFLICCDTPNPITDYDKPENYITTKINLSGEFNAMPEVPISNTDQTNSLSRTTSEDLYAIQIYSADKPNSIYAKYAYGLFDDLSKVEVELSDRMYYRFVVVAAKQAKNNIKQISGAYYEPFMINLKPTLLDNQFTYSTSAAFASLTLGRTAMADDLKTYDRPNADRYVGEVVDYQPVEGKTLEVLLKRVVFGIRLYSDDLVEGSVELTIDGAPSMSISHDNRSSEAIFTLKGAALNNKWIDDDYDETVLFKAKWSRPGLPQQVIGPAAGQQITVRRGYIRPIQIVTTYPKLPVSITMEPEQLLESEKVVF